MCRQNSGSHSIKWQLRSTPCRFPFLLNPHHKKLLKDDDFPEENYYTESPVCTCSSLKSFPTVHPRKSLAAAVTRCNWKKHLEQTLAVLGVLAFHIRVSCHFKFFLSCSPTVTFFFKKTLSMASSSTSLASSVVHLHWPDQSQSLCIFWGEKNLKKEGSNSLSFLSFLRGFRVFFTRIPRKSLFFGRTSCTEFLLSEDFKCNQTRAYKSVG